jgi:membrane-associated phospholipid phosphatase
MAHASSIPSGFWPARVPGADVAQGWRWLIAVTLVTLLGSIMLLQAPWLDIAVSQAFVQADGKFMGDSHRSLIRLRQWGRDITNVVVAALVIVLAAKLVRPQWLQRITWNMWWFITLGLALGPGLLVNLIMKPLYGRPRPIHTTMFGGAHEFVPAWTPSPACAWNCAFISGEASMNIWVIAFALFFTGWRRWALAGIAVVWGAAVSINRIAFGAHYLSDVLVAWGLTGMLVLALYVWLGPFTRRI